jgi:hypothetical protein
MSVLYQIEKLHYYMIDHGEVNWNLIDDLDDTISPKDVKKLIDYFILKLPRNHNVPGKVYETLCGIGDYSSQHNSISSKQFKYVFANIAAYWNEMDHFNT